MRYFYYIKSNKYKFQAKACSPKASAKWWSSTSTAVPRRLLAYLPNYLLRTTTTVYSHSHRHQRAKENRTGATAIAFLWHRVTSDKLDSAVDNPACWFWITFPKEIKKKRLCFDRESNPGQLNGNQLFYH